MLKASSQKVTAYNCISEHGSASKTAEILQAVGKGELCLNLGYPEDARKPENVEIMSTCAARTVTGSKDFGHWLFNEWLENSLADKTFVPSPAIKKVEVGMQGVQKRLDRHYRIRTKGHTQT